MSNKISNSSFWKGITAGVVAIALIMGTQAFEYYGTGKGSAGKPDAAVAEGAEGAFTPGTYEASEYGFGGMVTTKITIGEKGGIESVQIEGASETPDVGQKAIPELQNQILEKQSAEIDGVSGASLTSKAVKDGLAKVLAEASGEVVEGGATPEGDNLFVPGTYEGTAKGFGGDVVVTVTVDENNITDIQVVGDKETENIGSFAVEMLGGRMLEAQTVNVDALSGATVSSNAIKNAATQALIAAGCDIAKLPSAEQEEIATADKKTETKEYDIAIIGAGGAGMTAAISAKQAGKNVVIIEKMPYIGGNTTKASGGMNSAGTKMQAAAAEAEEDAEKKAAIEDSTVENFIADTMKGGHDINDIELVTYLAENSSDAIDWLESIGAPLPTIAATGGTTHYYLHEPEDGSAVGEYLVKFYRTKLDELGIDLMLETKATEILTTDGKVSGVKAESADTVYTVNANAVILATGGFGANFEMLSSFDASLANAVTTNTPAATGDGIVMAQALGADTVDLDQIQLHPTVYQASGLLVSERLRSNGAILVNKEGCRFTNDLATRDAVSQAELKQTDGTAFIVYDSKYAEEKLYKKYETNGITVSADTLEDLGKALGFDDAGVANFVETVEKWNKVCAGEQADEFGRDNGLVSLDQAPYTAIMIAPGIHHTMGGVKINTNAEVVGTDGNVIPGLFAAGEVTGGVHGGNRIGGNAVADIVVFGKAAGENAAAYLAQ